MREHGNSQQARDYGEYVDRQGSNSGGKIKLGTKFKSCFASHWLCDLEQVQALDSSVKLEGGMDRPL